MKYILNSGAMTLPFFVPSSVVDSNLKLASHAQLKVLLVFLRNVSTGNSGESIADFLGLPLSEVYDALEFWAQAGVLSAVGQPDEEPKKDDVKPTPVKSTVVKPTREEIAQVAFSDATLSSLLRETELKFARPLRASEMQTLAWLYLDNGMDASLILMVVEYAIDQGNTSTAFIERTALSWIAAGVADLAQAESFIAERGRKLTAWGMVEAAFGIEKRKPSDKELEYANTWVIEWGFGSELLRQAYNRCIDQKTKLNMNYIGGILERWYKDGIKTLADLETSEVKSKAAATKNETTGKNQGAYDKEFVKNMLNKD